MTRSISAAVSRDTGSPLTIEPLVLEDPRPDEVVVEVSHAGICHTDINAHHGLMGSHRPAVFGHEGAGTVVEVGSAVRRVSVGDSVLMSSMSCGVCTACLEGDPSYCETARALNMNAARADDSSGYLDTDVHSHFFSQSSFATHSLANERNVIRLPDDVPAVSAAPMGCGVLTGVGTILNVLKVEAGSSIAVFGAGAVGLSAVMTAAISGASTIIAVDMIDHRLELALELGATAAIRADDPDLLTRIRDLSGGGVRYSIEASGNRHALGPAVESLGRHGMCAVVGAPGDVEGTFRWRYLQLRGATIRGVVVGDANPRVLVPKIFDFYRLGRLPIDRIIQTYKFDDINTAFADAESGRAIKPVLQMV